MGDGGRPDALPDGYPNCTCPGGKREVVLYRLGYFCGKCDGWIGR